MPNPFEPAKSSPLTAAPLHHYPEFLPPSSFSGSEWPTWESIEPSMQALIANNTSAMNTNSNTHHHHTPSHIQTVTQRRPTITDSTTTALRKRCPSKPTEGLSQEDQARLLGEGFGVSELVEALKAKVEVDRVMGRLLEWRRVNQSGGMGKQQGVEEGVDGKGGEDGKGIGAVCAQ